MSPSKGAKIVSYVVLSSSVSLIPSVGSMFRGEERATANSILVGGECDEVHLGSYALSAIPSA